MSDVEVKAPGKVLAADDVTTDSYLDTLIGHLTDVTVDVSHTCEAGDGYIIEDVVGLLGVEIKGEVQAV